MSDPVLLKDILPAVLEHIETAYLNRQAPANTGASSLPKEHHVTYDAFSSWEDARLRYAEERDQIDINQDPDEEEEEP